MNVLKFMYVIRFTTDKIMSSVVERPHIIKSGINPTISSKRLSETYVCMPSVIRGHIIEPLFVYVELYAFFETV